MIDLFWPESSILAYIPGGTQRPPRRLAENRHDQRPARASQQHKLPVPGSLQARDRPRGPLHFHWCLKVLIGFVLIGHFVALSFRSDWLPALFSVPYPLFLTLVLAGGGFAIWHHLIMKRARRQAAGLAVLVRSGGLFSRIRHPIYLGDMVLYAGFAVYPATIVSLALLAVAFWAIRRQAVREDAELAESFGEQHAAWRARTGRFW